ncbi:ankyrin repeat domain-containing protein [Klebsiella sp. RHBSTW-00484]|uniref:ankyrin repeat domain-containing protein n=1 Tax=unclassified Klebsiella TaxID=2608929 RepID=UPI0015E503AD|nr:MULTISPECIES: ankyrin repeat domain-containing protein [unclassified Klebsiella]MBA7844635.1 ankyrin repeat domain-containing protein [Klebsiella sp. RHBSTW-00465]QLO34560.1 ankyrin repeat domain-containing protein [Klebsiella sp. RHBSTW-00484]QLT74074.1 ankyrin repeat domain-containing protein [Klebsiella sp. RHBSTW-00464]
MNFIKCLGIGALFLLAGCQSEEDTQKFLLACKYDSVANIETMLNNGIDVDGESKAGITGLMVAAAENRREVVELLLKHQAKPNIQTRSGTSALMLASARGSDVTIISDLINAKADVNLAARDKSTALMSAISDGEEIKDDYLHIIELKKPDEPQKEESALEKVLAASAEKSLAKNGRALMTEDMALKVAPGVLKKNGEEIVALLLKSGADVNAVNNDGETVFYQAVNHSRSAAMIKALTDAGADVNKADKEGTTPLMLAAANTDPELIKSLAVPGLDIDKTNRDGLTPLQVAAAYGAPAVITALVERGAKVDFLSPKDFTALMLAVKMEKKSSVAALLAAGANVNLKNKAGYAAVGYSRSGEIRQLLIENQADLTGQAALMAQSELQFCAEKLADSLAYSDIARSISGDTRPDMMMHRQECPGLGLLTMLLGRLQFKPDGTQYMGQTVTCTVSEHRQEFDVACH